MCYSARIQADYAKYRRQYGADIDIWAAPGSVDTILS